MATIRIKTPQNVILEYDSATVLERVMAYVLDLTILCMVCLVLAMILKFAGLGDALYLVIFTTIVFYSFVQEVFFNGVSLGKKVFHLKVIKLSGKEPDVFDYLMRWAFRFIDVILSAGTLGIATISSSNAGQRIGDILANTTVIKVDSQSEMYIETFFKRTQKKATDISYPEVFLLNDQYALLIKNTIERSQTYPSANNLKLAKHFADKIKLELDLRKNNQNDIVFLKTILHDYVVSTR